MTPRDNPRAGFTLIELLTVVSVIAILAAIILPTMGNARKTAQQTECISNLRQIGVSMSLYVAENNQRFPAMLDSATSNYWTAQLVPYMGEIKEKQRTIFICPGKEVAITVAADFASGGRTYAASRLILGPKVAADGVPPLLMSQIVRPASVVLVADSNQVPGNNGNSAFDLGRAPFNGSQTIPEGYNPDDLLGATLPNADAAPAGALRFRHSGENVANALMVDGHVAALWSDKLTYGNIYPLGE